MFNLHEYEMPSEDMRLPKAHFHLNGTDQAHSKSMSVSP